MQDGEHVVLTYGGGLADSNQLYYYEYSRSQYAFARFLATVENFRLNGRVTERITRGSYERLIISPPKAGSFIVDIAIQTASSVASTAISCQFPQLFSYIWQFLLPTDNIAKNDSLRLAKAYLENASERDKNETNRLREMRKIVEIGNITTQKALDITRMALTDKLDRFEAYKIGERQIVSNIKNLQSDILREKELIASAGPLTPEMIADLAAKCRPMVYDISLPLRSSAKRLSVGNAANDNAYISGDESRFEEINTRALDATRIKFNASVRRYDRVAKSGKLSSPELRKDTNFTLDFSRRDFLNDKAIDALKKQSVEVEALAYRDEAGHPTSLVLVDINI